MSSERRNLRVLHVVPWISAGGVEKRRLMLARHLPADVEQKIFSLATEGPLADELRALGVAVSTAGRHWGAHDVTATLRLVREIDRFRPDIVHGAVFEGTIQATLATMLRPRRKLILEEIDFPIHRSVRGSAYCQLLFSRADACVGVSEAVGEYLRKVLRLPEDKVIVINNGIEAFEAPTADERAAIRNEWGFGPDNFVVVAAGRMYEIQKRMADTLKAFALLRKRVPHAGLVIIGDGPDRGHLEALAASLHIDVRFLGYRRDVGRLLSAGDAFASASNRESFGQVIVEGMLAGLPVVTTPVGGPAEIVVPHKTGFFVPVENPEAMCEALAMLAERPEMRTAFGQAGRERAATLYTSERYSSQVLDLYRRMTS